MHPNYHPENKNRSKITIKKLSRASKQGHHEEQAYFVLRGVFYGGAINPNVQAEEDRPCSYDFKGRRTGEPIYDPAWSGEGFITITPDTCRPGFVFIQIDELITCINVEELPPFNWERSVGVGSTVNAETGEFNGITDEGLEFNLIVQAVTNDEPSQWLVSVKGRRTDDNFGDIVVYTAGYFYPSSIEERDEAIGCNNGDSGNDCQCGIPPPPPPNETNV